MITTTERPPLSQKIIFALGQLGWSLAVFSVANLLVYFYMPPEEGTEAMFPTFIFQGAIIGSLTLVGLINFGGRAFDAITDPLIASWADRKESKFGKRKALMAIACVPLAVFSFLIFYPPFGENLNLNSIWVTVSIFLFYFFYTLYVIPYTALISELGHHPEDRMNISTLIAVTWTSGFMIGSTVYALQAYFETSYDPTYAFQLSIGIFTIIGLVFMLIPILFLNENKYAIKGTTQSTAITSLKEILKDKNYTLFAIADMIYWLSLTFIQLGIGFYVPILFGFDKAQATQFLAISFVTSFLFYVPVNWLVKRFGKRSLILVAFVLFSITFGMLAMIEYLPMDKLVLFYTIAILSGFPLAVFSIVPNALIADFVHIHKSKTGDNYSAMFYGFRNFTTKFGISVANLLFPSLLLFGRSTENPQGVILTAWMALIFCIIGFALFYFVKDLEEA